MANQIFRIWDCVEVIVVDTQEIDELDELPELPVAEAGVGEAITQHRPKL